MERKAQGKTVQKQKYKFNIDDYIIAEKWIFNKPDNHFYDVVYLKILEFYCIHSPLTLDSLGWGNPWKSSKFRKKVLELLELTKENFQVIEYHHNYKKMWDELNIDAPSAIDTPFAYLAQAGETNDYMNLLHRIRNSLAHGRFTVVKSNSEYYIYFEDVKRSNGYTYVVGRMCLKKTSLDKLRRFICMESNMIDGYEHLMKR